MPHPSACHTACLTLPQAFYDDHLEAFFSSRSAALGEASEALPPPAALVAAVVVDLGLAAAFAVHKLGGGVASLGLACAATALARRYAQRICRKRM